MFYSLFLALPPALVVLAVAWDRRSRRSYGLGLLAVLVLVLDLWGIIVVSQALQQARASHTVNLSAGLIALLYEFIGLYLTLVLVLGGIAETMLARQRRWLALIVTVTVVLAVIIIAPGTALVPDLLGALGLSRDGETVLLLLVPVFVILAYAIARTFRPVAPHGPRDPQSTGTQRSR